jgi:hypothetical protein
MLCIRMEDSLVKLTLPMKIMEGTNAVCNGAIDCLDRVGQKEL